MKPGLLRLLIACLNMLCIGGIAFLGYRLYAGAPIPPAEQIPSGFNAVTFAIEGEGGRENQVEAYRAVWEQLDRPKRAVPQEIVRAEPMVRQPTANDLSRLFTLVMASINVEFPEKSTVIVEDRSRRQFTLRVGQSFPRPSDGYQVSEISIEGERDQREAILTVTSRGRSHTIKLKPRGLRGSR